MGKTYKVLLYYKYVPIENPMQLMEAQRALCQRLNIKGRIIIATEGINGTVAGESHSIDQYIHHTQSLPEFSDMEWKISWADEQVFPKLKVKIRPEIVTLGIKKSGTDVSLTNKAHYIEPHELLNLYERNEDFIILDARNLYEATIGKFKNSIIPPIDNFREFPEFAKKIAHYKDKNVVTYCTGGIRCEKASAYLREQGFKKVRQLHGGIHEYGEQTGGKYFEGEMFVFDKRLHVPVNITDPTILTSCTYCQQPITRYVDCANSQCHELYICCAECQARSQSTCSPQCMQEITNRPHSTSPNQSA